MMEYHFDSGSSSSQSNHNYLQPTSLTSQRSLLSIPSLNNTHHHHNHHLITTLKNHTSSYTSSLTLFGNFLLTGSSDREITTWNITSQQNTTTNKVIAGKGAVKSLIIQPNTDTLFSAHQDHKIRVWKLTNDQTKYTHLATLPTLGDRASKILIPKNHIQIRRHKKCTWVHHVDTVSSLALSKDGNFLYSVSWDRTIKIWRTRDFTCLESITNAHDDAINAVAVSYSGVVYTGSADKKIKVWKKLEDDKKGKEKQKHYLVDTLEKHNSGINALVLSSDESVLYSGACDRSILVWEKLEEEEDEYESGKMIVVGALRGHRNSILCLAVVGDFVCSGSNYYDPCTVLPAGNLLFFY
ncbi:protein JINGUBANG [Cicer arietinum]|uniref:Protein JINGUBANG n=1 Tax=Cicer arietinum TaxID=3827 RepID=A0A3Q7YBG2_CICAR|nr:protein JINGUBANG [Cicer arietinum]